ncbi:hypothetical protein T459_01156 [Capsicum annuum]|uniref:Protein FAR1-RELATED SEQUENCE n=1 Tax=Capsicum annuum TaxID=4072 RepID=A0A2G3AGB6_CAPAN|nr:hypothetical protein T459_01156 [Capsicum annuum]
MRHLSENLWVNHHYGEHLYLFYNAAKAYSPDEFSDYFVEFKNYCLEAAFFLDHELGFEKWSGAYFPGNSFDMMTKNIAESVNAILIAEREYPVVSIFNLIAERFGEIFRERRPYVLKYKDNKFVFATEKILRDNMNEGDSFYMENHGEDYGLRVYYYSSPVYKVEEYLLAYSKLINVVPLKSEWRVPQELLDMNIIPPLVVTKLGRKKRKHVKGVGETFKSKRRNKCSLCKRPGHKRTTCNNYNRS